MPEALLVLAGIALGALAGYTYRASREPAPPPAPTPNPAPSNPAPVNRDVLAPLYGSVPALTTRPYQPPATIVRLWNGRNAYEVHRQ